MSELKSFSDYTSKYNSNSKKDSSLTSSKIDKEV